MTMRDSRGDADRWLSTPRTDAERAFDDVAAWPATEDWSEWRPDRTDTPGLPSR